MLKLGWFYKLLRIQLYALLEGGDHRLFKDLLDIWVNSQRGWDDRKLTQKEMETVPLHMEPRCLFLLKTYFALLPEQIIFLC